jgi:hypothetical protein
MPTSTASAPLTDTQLVLLSRASQRDDGLLAPLDSLRDGAARSVASRLLIAELATEVPVGRDDPHWSRDEAQGRWVGLRISPAGLRAIGIEAEDPDGGGNETGGGVPSEANHAICAGAVTPKADPPDEPSLAPPRSGREGTKRALVISLLSRPEGAGLDELVAATGWLPHTTRAALTGLRQRGHALARSRDAAGRTVYRIAAPEPAPGPVTAAESGAQIAPAETRPVPTVGGEA